MSDSKVVTLTQEEWIEQIEQDKARRVQEFTIRMHQLAEHYQVNVYGQIQLRGNGTAAVTTIVVEAR